MYIAKHYQLGAGAGQHGGLGVAGLMFTVSRRPVRRLMQQVIARKNDEGSVVIQLMDVFPTGNYSWIRS